MTSKEALVKKIIKSKKKILNESLERLDTLLTLAQNLELDNSSDRWMVHHCLLSEIPILEKLLELSEYDKKEQVINRVRKIADNLAPVPDYGVYR